MLSTLFYKCSLNTNQSTLFPHWIKVDFVTSALCQHCESNIDPTLFNRPTNVLGDVTHYFNIYLTNAKQFCMSVFMFLWNSFVFCVVLVQTTVPANGQNLTCIPVTQTLQGNVQRTSTPVIVSLFNANENSMWLFIFTWHSYLFLLGCNNQPINSIALKKYISIRCWCKIIIEIFWSV